MPRVISSSDLVILTDEGELSYAAILHGLHVAIIAAKTEASWVVDDLARAVWEEMATGYRSSRAVTHDSTRRIQQMLRDIGYGDIATHFRFAPTVHHLSLVTCLSPTLLQDELDFSGRVHASVRRLHSLGAHTLHITGLAACEHKLSMNAHLFPMDSQIPVRTKIVQLVRRELLLLTWQYPLTCYLT